MGRMKSRFALAAAALVAGGFFFVACRKEEAPAPEPTAAPASSSAAAAPAPASKELIGGGGYLVTVMGCNDCHTPYKMGKNGPEPDMSRMLSGHPENMKMPPPPKLQVRVGSRRSAGFRANSRIPDPLLASPPVLRC